MQSRGNNAVLHHFTKTIHAHGHIAQMRNALSQIIGERGYRLFLGSRIFTGRTTLGEMLRGVRFPRSPSELGANTPVRHADYLSAIEYTAGLLLPDVRRLREFEHFRGEASSVSCDSDAVDGDSDAEAISLARAQEQLQAAESLFGFSLWLSAEWMRLDEPGSERLVARASALLEQSKNPVIQLAVRFLYARRNGVYAAKQTAEVIHSYDIPEALKRFLLGVAHPAPFFSAQAVTDVLTLAATCPAVDQWCILLRCCQSLHATNSANLLSRAFLLRDLLRAVPTLETRRLREAIFAEKMSEETSVDVIEAAIVAAASPTDVGSDDALFRLLAELVRRAAGIGLESALGALVSLDKLALDLSGTRFGTLIALMVRGLHSLTDIRSEEAQRWFELVIHPDAIRVASKRSLFGLILTRGEILENLVPIENADVAARSGDWARMLSSLPSPSNTRETSSLTIDALLRLGKTEKALLTSAIASVEYPTLLHRLPFDELAALIGDDLPETLEQALAMAVILDFCVRNLSPRYSVRRGEAVEDCLELAEVAYPSELVPHCTSEVERRLLPHFLRTICVPSVLDSIPIGKSTKELLGERLRILQYLHQEQEGDVNAIEAEIVALSAELAVAAESRTLNQKRIYVDVEGLSARLVATLRNDYELYRSYLRIDPRKTQMVNLHRLLQEIAPDAMILDINDVLRNLTSELDRLLVKMIEQTRKEFALSKDYGLDGYLSGGIRHGNLEAILREPFVANNILGTFSGSNRFVPPSLYATISASLLRPQQDAVHNAFHEFAKKFQILIDEVLEEWIRIATYENKPKAFFDLTLTVDDVKALDLQLASAPTLEDFLGVALKYWWQRVDVSLTRARREIRTNLRERLEQLLSQLLDKLRAVQNPIFRVFIDNLIAPTRRDLEAAIENLADWFQLAESETSGEINPELAVAVARSTVAYLHPRTTIDLLTTVNVKDRKFERKSMKHWVDMLLTMFHNVIRHSGQSDPCRIAVTLSVCGQTVQLTVVNPLGPQVDMTLIDRRIADVNEQISADAYLPAVQREGRTGLMKVLKAAKVDLRAPQSKLRVERHGDKFSVHLDLPDLSCVVGGPPDAHPDC